jgi:DNA-binding HxlR family transcriptional regulator
VAVKEAEERLNAQVEKCEIANIWEVLGRRWALLILKNLNTKEANTF